MIERRVSTVITEEQIKHVAKLSKLSFSGGELADFTNQLDKIIDMMELLEGVDTTGISFTSNVNEPINVMRRDVVTSGMNCRELMRNVPESENGYIRVPVIMDNEETGA